jgi:hypothetical protein
MGAGPYGIPVSAPLRIDERRIAFALEDTRGSLGRMRARPDVALTILAEGDIAFTARGRAHIVEEPIPRAPDFTAVVIDVDEIDDHRSPAFHITGGIDREWIDEDSRLDLADRLAALRELVSG